LRKETKTINLDNLIIGADGFNVRPLDEEFVQRYQDVADNLPPVEGWRDSDTGQIFLVDGRHRYEARRRVGYDTVDVTLLTCSRVDAEVRAFSANLSHPLPLTKLQRRLAIAEIVRRRYTRSNNWIAEEAKCSPQTVAKIREELEAEQKIPVLERLERKGGGTTPREFNRTASLDRTDSLFGNDPDFFDEVEEAEKANRDRRAEVKPPADLTGQVKPSRDGGYDVEADERGGAEFESVGPLITGLERSDGSALDRLRSYSRDDGPAQPRMLKFAQLNEGGLTIEVTLYVDGRPYSIPVTLMLAEGTIFGLPETSLPESRQTALILDTEIARQLKLVY
jgi:hypothetical protein